MLMKMTGQTTLSQREKEDSQLTLYHGYKQTEEDLPSQHTSIITEKHMLLLEQQSQQDYPAGNQTSLHCNNSSNYKDRIGHEGQRGVCLDKKEFEYVDEEELRDQFCEQRKCWEIHLQQSIHLHPN